MLKKILPLIFAGASLQAAPIYITYNVSSSTDANAAGVFTVTGQSATIDASVSQTVLLATVDATFSTDPIAGFYRDIHFSITGLDPQSAVPLPLHFATSIFLDATKTVEILSFAQQFKLPGGSLYSVLAPTVADSPHVNGGQSTSVSLYVTFTPVDAAIVEAVPEPTTPGLFGIGLVALGLRRARGTGRP